MTAVELCAEVENRSCSLAAFQTSSWYSKFKSVCFPTCIVPLPRSAVEFLESDGISAQDLPSAVPPIEEASGSSDDEADSTTDGDASTCQSHDIEPLKAQLASAIEQLGGQVVPKLNWSAPVDATWISPDGLRCSNPDEVLLLLKSSERAAHDLHCISSSPPCPADLASEAAATPTGPVRPEIVLKQFKILDHSMEFRAFVLDHSLAGISQRDPTQHFPAIQDRLHGIKCSIKNFHQQHMAAKFDQPRYAFDVYVTKKLRVKLLDINPAHGTTQALLFSWDELTSVSEGLQAESRRCSSTCTDEGPCAAAGEQQELELELRIVQGPMHIQTSAKSMFGVPVDTLDMPGVSWPGIFDALQEQCRLEAGDAAEWWRL